MVLLRKVKRQNLIARRWSCDKMTQLDPVLFWCQWTPFGTGFFLGWVYDNLNNKNNPKKNRSKWVKHAQSCTICFINIIKFTNTHFNTISKRMAIKSRHITINTNYNNDYILIPNWRRANTLNFFDILIGIYNI